jgi:IMP dehydrogenase
MKGRIKRGYTFDDVLIEPKRSSIVSRKDVNTGSYLSRRIRLSIPIVSANMDTVTEANMAITMSRLGAMGIIHRFMTIEEEAEQVRRVKRAESFIVSKPCALEQNRTLREAQMLMKEYGIASVIVLDKEGKLVGILTSRDTRFEENLDVAIVSLMTKKENLITATPTITLQEAKEILRKHKIEKLPLVDSNGYLKGLITAKDILKTTQYPSALKDEQGRLLAGAAIGVTGDYKERAQTLVDAGVDVLVIDIAHGHLDLCIETVQTLKKMIPDKIDIIAGNVATKGGTRDLIEAGADAVKVGVGPGAACDTRQVAGAGVPQLSAILECAEVACRENIPIIADGGIKDSGDIAKALAAGASSVMIGRLFAGTDESPGQSIIRKGRRYKIYRGMASLSAASDRAQRDGSTRFENLISVVPEGVETEIPYQGSVVDILFQLEGGLRSGMSYCGAKTVQELQGKTTFIVITEAGRKESLPHEI